MMGYTQQAAADAIGIARQTYQDMLRGVYRNSGKPAVISRMTELACVALYLKVTSFDAAKLANR